MEEKMKKAAIILASVIVTIFLFTSCQKAKETEGKKEVLVQQSVQHKEEIKQQPTETKPEVQPQQEQPPTKLEVKEEKKEKSIEKKPSPLTEEEQREFEELKKKWLSPKFTEADAMKALRIIVKADLNSDNIRWYFKSGGNEPGSPESGDDICDLLRMLGGSTKKEAFELTLEVLKKDTGYPTVCAAKEIKHFNNKEAIPYLRKYLNYIASNEQLTEMLRLEAAGSLLAIGDADAALPVLDELTKEGKTAALGYIFHNMQGKEWEKRGIELIRNALTYENNESKALAALFLIGLTKKRILKEDLGKIENMLLDTFKGILNKPKWDKSPESEYSDYRALESIILALEELNSKKAIPFLKRLKEHPEASYLKSNSIEAIKHIKSAGRK